MKCTILHEGKGRMRVHVEKVRMTLHRADVLEAYLNHNDAIVHATVYERTGDVVITYTGKRSAAVALLAGYKFDVAEYDALVTSADSRKLNREYQDKMFNLVAGRCLRKLFLPAPIAAAYTAFRSIGFIWKGVRCVLRRKLEVEVLDALSIGVSMLRGDFATAGSVMFLLNLGSLLEEWTRKKSLDDLARSMALNVDKVWVRSQGTEVLMPLTKVRTGDQVVVRSGNMIPLDGTVLEGEAMVNQAALTGEAMPVRKAEGSCTEPEPDAAPDEALELPGTGCGTPATLLAACSAVSGRSNHNSSSSSPTSGSGSGSGMVCRAVLLGFVRSVRFCLSSSRTVRTAHTPAAAAASRQAASTSAKPLPHLALLLSVPWKRFASGVSVGGRRRFYASKKSLPGAGRLFAVYGFRFSCGCCGCSGPADAPHTGRC